MVGLGGVVGVIDPHAAVAIRELVDVAENVWDDNPSVAAFEAIEVSFACRLDAVNVIYVAATGGVGVIGDFLSPYLTHQSHHPDEP